MDRDEFEQLVAEVVEALPEELHNRMDNVEIMVEDWPTREQLAEAGLEARSMLLGLYEGVPLTERGAHYGMVAPDKITIFQKPIEAKCQNGNSIAREIQDVVRHEIAHHFGIGDVRLKQIEDGHNMGQS